MAKEKNNPSEDAETPLPTQPPPAKPATEKEEKSASERVIATLFLADWKDVEPVLKKELPVALKEKWSEYELDDYNPILFFDEKNSIGEDHADRIYNAVCDFDEERDILLMLGSRGGRIEPAYLASKNCKAKAKGKFVVAIPRRAKSAATLLALGADEIHMGSMSELGPIDPQLGNIPAQALSNALKTLARTVSDYPKSSEMFARYLESQLDLGILGYFERINESATQYATRLLSDKQLGKGMTAQTLASHLVNHYKDHSFVIDKDEAIGLFGDGIIKVQTNEYSCANRMDSDLRWMSKIARIIHRKELTFIGDFDSCLKVKDVNEED